MSRAEDRAGWIEVDLPHGPRGARVDLRREGDGRFHAYLFSPGWGAVFVGVVLGASRRWSVEPSRSRPAFVAHSRVAAARQLAALEFEWREQAAH